MKKPSIVAPGGSLDKALIALNYGADSVYIGSSEFGLRKSSENFSFSEIAALCNYAQQNNKCVYLTLNIFPHEQDINQLRSFFSSIQPLGLNALIISDLGLCKMSMEYTDIPVHVSTQASVLNSETARLWASLGVKRIVLAREASLKESQLIKQQTNCETEVFIHGAMCSSFSGKCTISNVASGRDSNRGGCIQSCRHNYTLSNDDDLYIMNSKDLRGIELIPDYFKYQIDAVKIEGRMKSPLYVANAVQQYRRAIDLFSESPDLFTDELEELQSNLNRASNRGFTTASLKIPAEGSSISYDWNGYTKSHQFVGFIRETNGSKSLLHAKIPLKPGQSFTYISPDNYKSHETIIDSLTTDSGSSLSSLPPNECAWIDQSLPKHSILLQS